VSEKVKEVRLTVTLQLPDLVGQDEKTGIADCPRRTAAVF